MEIVHEVTLPYAPELVWRVLTTPELMGSWLMQTTFTEAKVGHAFRFQDRPRKPFWDGLCDCEVVEAQAPHRFVLTWGTNQATPTKVEWTLSPEGTGTRVTFRHTGLQGLSGWFMQRGMSKGWRQMLERSWPFILSRLAAGQPAPSRDEVKAVQRGAGPVPGQLR